MGVTPQIVVEKTVNSPRQSTVDLQRATLAIRSMTMVSGLTGAANGHSHFFRDFAKLTRADALAHTQGSPSVEITPNEADLAEEPDPTAKASEEMITKLEARNRDVLAHEAAHLAAAGGYAKGGASYTYQIGPDGKPYAIGGEVSIDMSPVPGNPRATITKMMAIRAAALSPADPSGQDMSVAAAAAQIEAQARAQLNNQSVAKGSAPTIMRSAAGRYAQPAWSAGILVNAIA